MSNNNTNVSMCIILVVVDVELLLSAPQAKVPCGVNAATLSLLFLLDHSESTLSSMMHKVNTF